MHSAELDFAVAYIRSNQLKRIMADAPDPSLPAGPIVAVPPVDEVHPDIVCMVVRWAEYPSIMCFLTHEAEHDAWFPPSGKIEPGETAAQAAKRELQEETGLILPAESPLRQVSVLNLERDGAPYCKCTFFAVDLPAKYFTNQTYRSYAVARKMSKDMVDNGPVNAPASGTRPCPVCPGVQVAYHDFALRGGLDHSPDPWSFGQFEHVYNVKEAVEVDAVDINFEGYRFRYNASESPLWKEYFRIYDDRRPLSEIIRITSTPADVAAITHGISQTKLTAENIKLLPKLQSISGKDQDKLNRALKALPQQLELRDIDVKSLAAVQFVAGLFTDELAEWWAMTGSSLPITNFDQLAQMVRAAFELRDVKQESLFKLKSLSQTDNTQEALSNYTQAFNRCIHDWSESGNFDLFGSMYVLGLSDPNIRMELTSAMSTDATLKGSYGLREKMATLQQKASQAFVNRTDHAAGKKRVRHDDDTNANKKKYNNGASSSNGGTSNGGSSKKGGGSSNGKTWKGKNQKGKQNQNGYAKKKPSGDPDVAAARKKLSKQEIDECFKKGQCLICKQTGHLARDCPNKKE